MTGSMSATPRPRLISTTILALLLAVACSPHASSPPENASPSPSFRPAAATPTQAVDELEQAWTHADRTAAAQVASQEVVSALFDVSPKGWSDPKCKQGLCRLKKMGVLGAMTWSVQGGSTGYFVNNASIPPIPLEIAHLPKPVWGLYLAAGGSGYSQLAAATSQLEGLGLTSQTIGQLVASCQSPVPEGLQIPASFYTVAVFFQRKAEAEAFRGELDFPALGLLKVKVTC
jgi:hypothetical protein